mmetsp:Transcript_22723/g.77300  ORF Transcript_22723/g.77300 Transcript_22723/m.77300 type:complete len:1214 (-) Transcript_22723:91-3732(-)|eukprot:CAMPEP_0183799074 /NCGR_PEP_ID=MMETSP0803_2-20130417/20654_1 /TAXON_ID=195967 /ORGANISM="Crustomastix stigmata, Strain CCMP3273" /LENGTH=1213 /DNA_ID=CAMNT_0026043775 /DNA_START=154 /DNA_END=3795 /DNA_ORIENTATION=-
MPESKPPTARKTRRLSVHSDDPELYLHLSNAGPEMHDLGPEFDDNSVMPYSELCINKGWDPVPPETGAAALKVACQDDAILVRHYGNNERWAFAGVFDGHGTYGREAAHYTRDTLHATLLEELEASPAGRKDVGEALKRSFKHVHEGLLRCGADMRFSGTTATVLVVMDNELTVGQVGDSKAVCMSVNGSKVTAKDLSMDQRPESKEEKSRIVGAGGDVLQVPDERGNLCGPHRVFKKGAQFPGIALSRSLGDSVATGLGVTYEPVVTTYDLKKLPNAECIVLATDGLWEHYGSEEVGKYLSSVLAEPGYGGEDADTAVMRLAKDAQARWLKADPGAVVDDCTVLALWVSTPAFLRSNAPGTKEAMRRRPKRRAGFSSEATTAGGEGATKSKVVPKSKETAQAIREALRKHFLFKPLPDDLLAEVIDAMFETTVAPGEEIIVQGQVGDNLYVCLSGALDCFVGSQKVLNYGPSSCFGELALLYGSPRAATVKATTTSKLWALDRGAFTSLVVKNSQASTTVKYLLEVPLFSGLTEKLLTDVAEKLKVKEVKAGQQLHKIGDVPDSVYFVAKGEARLVDKAGKKRVLGCGSPLAERVAMYEETLRESIEAETALTLLAVHTDDFKRFSHMISKQLERHIICSLLRKHVPAVSDVSDSELEELAALFTWETLTRGDRLCKIGTISHKLYLLNQGQVFLEKEGAARPSLAIEGAFGVSALMLTDEKEPADVTVGSEEAKLVMLDEKGCDKVLSLLERRDILGALKKISLLAPLSVADLQSMVEEIKPRAVKPGEVIIKQGEMTGSASDKFYIIHSGEVVVQKHIEKGKPPKEIVRLQKHDWFGERALLSSEPRAADCVASTDGYVFELSRRTFETRLGPLRDVMETHAQWLEQLERSKMIKFEELELKTTLGMGTFGRVRLVRHKPTGEAYALKCLSKRLVVRYKQQQHVRDERLLMDSLTHPFCTRLITTFKDSLCVYMLLELTNGGELFKYLDMQPEGRFKEPDARFYAACVLLVLEHMHEQNIVYRDLKPENLLLDAEGYIKVVDYGFAKKVESRTYTVCGTPDYIAPEIIMRKGHNKAVDWWALGVLIYEMCAGVPPFSDEDSTDQQIYSNILELRYSTPASFSPQARDIIKKLLVRDVNIRLGCGRAGSRDVKRHPWFQDLDWIALERRKLKPPVQVRVRDPFDTSNFDRYPEQDNIEPPERGTTEWDDVF